MRTILILSIAVLLSACGEDNTKKEKTALYIKSATTGLKYINAGEKDIGCTELRYSYLALIEIDAPEAKEIGEGYKLLCR